MISRNTLITFTVILVISLASAINVKRGAGGYQPASNRAASRSHKEIRGQIRQPSANVHIGPKPTGSFPTPKSHHGSSRRPKSTHHSGARAGIQRNSHIRVPTSAGSKNHGRPTSHLRISSPRRSNRASNRRASGPRRGSNNARKSGRKASKKGRKSGRRGSKNGTNSNRRASKASGPGRGSNKRASNRRASGPRRGSSNKRASNGRASGPRGDSKKRASKKASINKENRPRY